MRNSLSFLIVALILALVGGIVISLLGLNFFTVFPFTWGLYPYWAVGISILLMAPYLVWRVLKYVKPRDSTPLQSSNKYTIGIVGFIYVVSVGITAYYCHDGQCDAV